MIKAYREITGRKAERGFPTQHAAEVVLPGLGVRNWAILEFIGLMMLTVWALCVVSGSEILAIATLIAFALGFYRMVARIRFRSTSIVCQDDRVLIRREGNVEARIPYSNVKKVTLSGEGGEWWLQIDERDGVTHFWTFHPMFGNPQRICSEIGPLLRKDTEFNRGPRPANPLNAFDWDHFHHLPLVEMQPGVSYRYIFPREIREKVLGVSNGSAWPAVLLLPIFNALRHLPVGPAFTIAIVILVWSGTQYSIRKKFSKSLEDRFRIGPDGLEIERKGKRWVVPLEQAPPSRFFKIKLVNGYVQRLGSGDKSYYFDPRLIEPDV